MFRFGEADDSPFPVDSILFTQHQKTTRFNGGGLVLETGPESSCALFLVSGHCNPSSLWQTVGCRFASVNLHDGLSLSA